jgi:RecB family exonuclease
VSAEQTLKKEFALDSERSIMFKAIIDRIDERDGMLRIVDYKTGKGPDRYNDLSDLFDSESKKKYDVTRQMFLYAYMCGKKENLITAPYLLREIVKGNSNEELVTPEMTEAFEDLLRTKVLEIFDKSIPFVQTEIVERCEFCPFNVICR